MVQLWSSERIAMKYWKPFVPLRILFRNGSRAGLTSPHRLLTWISRYCRISVSSSSSASLAIFTRRHAGQFQDLQKRGPKLRFPAGVSCSHVNCPHFAFRGRGLTFAGFSFTVDIIFPLVRRHAVSVTRIRGSPFVIGPDGAKSIT